MKLLARRLRWMMVALIGGSIVALVAGVLPLPEDGSRLLEPARDFSIRSSVSGPLLPGVERRLAYSVENPLDVPITVQAISIAAVSAPAACPASNLDLGATAFTGALNIGPGATATAPSVPISLLDDTANQDACKEVTFTFSYTGSATYMRTFGSRTSLASTPNPSATGEPVTFVADVAPVSPAPGLPTGSVSFYACLSESCEAADSLGRAAVDATGVATFTTAALRNGSVPVYASYDGDANFTASASPLIRQLVGIVQPAQCRASYARIFTGDNGSPHTITGTSHADLINVDDASYAIDSRNGGDCVVAGNGNNRIVSGNQADVIIVGDGNNTITTGAGDDVVIAGHGTNLITSGAGGIDVTLGDGSRNVIRAGNGPTEVSIGAGASNTLHLGNGSASVRINGGSHNVVNGGKHAATVHLGTGRANSFFGQRNFANVCHIPAAPASWSGSALEYYGHRVVNCTVVVSP
jgi:hypothetical protein